jgi:hypothetical protein
MAALRSPARNRRRQVPRGGPSRRPRAPTLPPRAPAAPPPLVPHSPRSHFGTIGRELTARGVPVSQTACLALCPQNAPPQVPATKDWGEARVRPLCALSPCKNGRFGAAFEAGPGDAGAERAGKLVQGPYLPSETSPRGGVSARGHWLSAVAPARRPLEHAQSGAAVAPVPGRGGRARHRVRLCLDPAASCPALRCGPRYCCVRATAANVC